MTKRRKCVCIFLFLFLIEVPKVFSSFSIEELRQINYEVDILKTPVKKSDPTQYSIVMKSKFGQEYKCVLPQVAEEEASKKELLGSDKNLDIKELLKPLKARPCLLKVQDWWTYEICLGHYIKQFHIEESHIVGQVITLGLYDSDYDWSNETNQERFKNVKQPYHTQWYVNGTKCDLTGEPRNAELRFICEPDTGDYVHRVDEQETCSYIVTILTSSVCSHPNLKPKVAKKAHVIPCHPLLDDKHFESYMKKQKETKELEERERSEFLKKQEKHLQDMKNEKLQKTEESTDDSNEIDIEKKNDASSEKENIEDGTIDQRISSFKVKKNKLIEKYSKDIDRLKSLFSPHQFSEARKRIQSKFDKILTEFEEENDQNPELGGDIKVVFLRKLTVTLNALLTKLSNTEQEALKATEELNKATEMLSKTEKVDTDIQGAPKDDIKKSAPSDDDNKLQVHIRKLNVGSIDSGGKLIEQDSKKLEQAVKERLEKLGFGFGDRKVEVKIITAEDPFETGDLSKLESLTEEETMQFQNMIMAMLTGQQESVQETERHRRLEQNYRHNWEEDEEDV